jgi:membrane-bound metal-dependent hydrolase YbcI (DUF457 family)
MPTPAGHLLAGVTVSLFSDQRRGLSRRWGRIALVCALLAAAPDLDLLYPGGHRMMTHSLFAVGLVLLAAAASSRGLSGRVDWRLTLACTLAYGSHLLTDYLGMDYGSRAGLQLLWPWSGQWFISDWFLFRGTERHNPFSSFAILMNLRALAQEALVIGPLFLLAWFRRRRLTHSAGRASQSTDRRAA